MARMATAPASLCGRPTCAMGHSVPWSGDARRKAISKVRLGQTAWRITCIAQTSAGRCGGRDGPLLLGTDRFTGSSGSTRAPGHAGHQGQRRAGHHLRRRRRSGDATGRAAVRRTSPWSTAGTDTRSCADWVRAAIPRRWAGAGPDSSGVQNCRRFQLRIMLPGLSGRADLFARCGGVSVRATLPPAPRCACFQVPSG